ncbi:MAG: DNRLRE domain-containing protein [Fimbriiglobus sp.]
MRSKLIFTSLTLTFLTLGLFAISSKADQNPSPAKKRLVFQQGVNGFKGTVDTEIWAVSPNTILEANINASSDSDNDGGESQVLMRFDGIVGTEPGRLPPNSMIHSATLVVSAFDEGTTVHLHRLLVPWKRSSTWNSLVAGITADGLEASPQKSSFTFGKIAASTSEIDFAVTDDVQAWANGDTNHGWVFINTAGNGWDFYTSEFDDQTKRPKLVIDYTPPQTSSKQK